jgi:hypothetical protein
MENFLIVVILYFMNIDNPDNFLKSVEPVIKEAEHFNANFNFDWTRNDYQCELFINSTKTGANILSNCETF